MSDGHLLLGRRPRVVLIDDHRMFAQALGESLTARYDLVATAYRADEFLTLVQSTQADVALLDLQLPDRCGLDVIGDALRIQPALRILIVTMYRDRLLADTAIAAGAAGLIPKDAKTEELYYAIDQVLAGAQYLSPLLPKISHSVATEARHLAYRHLTRRQQQVAMLLGEGKSEAQIARSLGLAPCTITYHIHHLEERLGLYSHASLVRFAVLIRASLE